MIESGIYKIECTMNGRKYIGSSKDVLYRLRKHKERLRIGKHVNKALQNGFSTYGEECFLFEPMFFCKTEELLAYEQLVMDCYKTTIKPYGYNIRKKAESNSGIDSKSMMHRSGDKYNRLTLISLAEKNPNGNKWLCQCECGKETVATVSAVKYGKIKSCGCYKTETIKLRRKHQAGERYNYLTLVNFEYKGSKILNYWKALCDCGNEIVTPVSRIIRGKIKSCGCLRSNNSRIHITKINHQRTLLKSNNDSKVAI